MSESAETYGNPSEMSEGKQMTAVEWLEEQVSQILDWDLIKLFEQAKAMEKEQIIDAYTKGFEDVDAEQYTTKHLASHE